MATARPYGPTVPGMPGDGSLVGLVRAWSNRDAQALPDTIIMDSIRYAVDKAYRTLRIPPLEHTVVWTNYPGDYTYTDSDGMPVSVDIPNAAALATAQEANPGGTFVGLLDSSTSGGGNVYQSTTALQVPPDLIEFIHIRGTDSNGLTTRVFNEKSDIRSYWDIRQRHYEQQAFWSRQQDSVVLTPSFANVARGFYGGGAGSETELEMYYYRRLPALDATYAQSFFAWRSGLGTLASGLVFDSDMSDADNQVLYDADTSEWTGNPVPNWFKDENEKVALYGALSECFAYLQEDDQAGKYLQLFQQEIAELNEEDRMRDASGGNIQTQYTAFGLI